jgi:hypothetical protein
MDKAASVSAWGIDVAACESNRRETYMRHITILAPTIAVALVGAGIGACTSTTAAPVIACGPDNVATTNWDVVIITNYEAGFYWVSVDPIPPTSFTVVFTDGVTPDGSDSGAGSDPTAGTGTDLSSSGAAALADAGFDAAAIGAVTDAGSNASLNTVASIVAGAVGKYFPNGCATATANANVVTFQLHSCTGPLNLVNTTGTVTATFTAPNGALQVQLAGNNITANGAKINLMTTATVSMGSNGQKAIQATSQTSGTGPYGNSAVHMGMYTVLWPTGTGCATINGTLSGVGTGTYGGTTTQISNYVTCANKCPQSGTTMSSFNGGTVTLTFNGTSNAQCTSSLGTSAPIPIHCP